MKPRKSKRAPNPKNPQRAPEPPWRFYISYFVLMIVLLVTWQAIFTHLTVRTIPYSEFKAALARSGLP